MDWLEGTIFYQSVDEDSQECMRDGYFNSPDDSGDDNLADYEMLECTTNPPLYFFIMLSFLHFSMQLMFQTQS